MLQKIDKVHRKEVARYLQLVLLIQKVSLFDIALAVHKRIDDIVLFSPDIAIRDIRNHCRFTTTRIAATCKGFLEVQQAMDLHEWQYLAIDPASTADPSEERNFSKLLEDRNPPLDQRDDRREIDFYQRHTRVDFLHRTAVDFFKDNEQAKEFLEINAPMNPHPRISYAKARLANLTVFPIETDYVSIDITHIMYEACDAEAETGVAQVALMDLLDRSLAMLCQRSTGQPSQLHWCRAWGFPKEFSSSPLKLQIQSSSESRHDGGLTPYPVDFLGFAARFGLHKYVEHILDSQSERLNPSTSDYLLNCAVGGFGDNDPLEAWKSYMKLISALLKRGANPNMETSEGTIWGSFLRTVCYVSYGNSMNGNSIYPWVDIETGLLGAVPEFLGKRANVNGTFYLDLEYRLDNFVVHSASSKHFRLIGYRISLHISALSVLQQCFTKNPKFSVIEEACIAFGAFPYFECTEVPLEVMVGDDIRWLDSKLSKQQLIQFSQTLDQRLRASAGKFPEKRQVVKRQIRELFQELDVEHLYEQACREKKLHIQPWQEWQEEDSQEDKSNDDIKEISDESDISAPDSPALEVEGPSHSAPSSQLEA